MAQAMSIAGRSVNQMTLLITQPRSEPFKKDLPQFSTTSTTFLCTTVFAQDVSDGKKGWISVNFYKANQVNISPTNKLWKQTNFQSTFLHGILHVVSTTVQTGDNATNSFNTEECILRSQPLLSYTRNSPHFTGPRCSLTRSPVNIRSQF